MDPIDPSALRLQTEKRRLAPLAPRVVRCPFGRPLRVDALEPTPPFELHLEATDGAGTLAAWLDDAWWTDLLQRWSEDAVTIVLDPSRDALLHPVVLHQFEMIRRVAPGWRVVGVAYRNDVAATDRTSAQALATSPYHELRFLDEARPAFSHDSIPEPPSTLAELLAAIRTEQERCGGTTPVLVRLPTSRVDAQDVGCPILATAKVGDG